MKNAFCFIICTNDKLWFNECVLYLERLYVPEGYEIELLGIENAKSMASGYNEGMTASDAKYKIYLHQDTFIINRYFLYDILSIFSDKAIGLIGVVGSPNLPADAIMWHGPRNGDLYSSKTINPLLKHVLANPKDCVDVECVDGLIIITSTDIPWREDLFDGWDFYDISQCFEFRRRGLRVVVPVQPNPWINHDAGKTNLWNYDKYRKIFMKEYLNQ